MLHGFGKKCTKKADPLVGFSYHKQDQPIEKVDKNIAICIANHASL
jgi:hypothetical protein